MTDRDDTTGNSVDLGYGKARAKIKGAYVWAVILTLMLVGVGWREFDRLDRSNTTGRDDAVTALSQQHGLILVATRDILEANRSLLCLMALEQQDRRGAVRSGDVCGYLLGSPRREPR